MKKILLMLLLTSPVFVQASFEEERGVLESYLRENPSLEGSESIRVTTQFKQKVPRHRYDNIRWADNCINGLTFWDSGPNPVPGAVKFLGGLVFTAGIWPAGILAVSGVAYGAEKIVKACDTRTQVAEEMTFGSERNLRRYIVDRLHYLMYAFDANHAPLGGERASTVEVLYLEVLTWLELPLPEKAVRQTVDVNSLALRINLQIHRYKEVAREPLKF